MRSASPSRSGLDPFDDGPEHDELESVLHRDLRGLVVAELHVAVECDVEGMFGIHLEAARRDVVVDGVPHVVVGLPAEDRHAGAFPRGIRQHLPGLVSASEVEDGNRDEHDDRNRHGAFDHRGAAFFLSCDHHCVPVRPFCATRLTSR